MSSRRRGKKAAHDGGHEGPDERWMASYMDMVTVLMCMFIVLFAMGNPDKGKYEELRISLANGFGTEYTELYDASQGEVIPEELLEKLAEGVTLAQLEAAVEEYDKLEALQEKLESSLATQGLEGAATFTIDERGLTLGLVSSETFFAANSTNLSPKAKAVLGAVGGVLRDEGKAISVEGHADYRAPSNYPTNWELSSARSTGVLRHLVEVHGIGPDKIGATGFGSARPITAGQSAEDLAKNRRVDVVVLSEEEEPVRALLPDVRDAKEKEAGH